MNDLTAREERRSPTPAAARKREAIRRLQAALREDRCILHYQPILEARSGRPTAVEALLRWRDGEGDHAHLSELIWSAERSPVISHLENWTLDHACRAARAWAGPHAGLRLNVNLSAREFPRADVVGRVRRRLQKAGLPAETLALEITETSSLRDFRGAARQFEQLQALGVELWLDDFGTGHSSLEWLSHLPVHGIKIPQTFVQRLVDSPRCRSIVARVIELAHELDLLVIAEGIETQAQRQVLMDQGCDRLQGYLLAAPLPAEELPSALRGVAAEGRSA